MANRTRQAKHTKIKKLFEKQGGLCHYCGREMLLTKGPEDGRCPPELATIEHLTPRAFGGTMSYDNTAAACFECNNGRGDGREINRARKSEPQARVCWQDD